VTAHDGGVVDDVVRVRARVTGVVEGVGFRPFVHRHAVGLGLNGEVGNDDAGVFLAAEGPHAAVSELLHRVQYAAPAPARVESLTTAHEAPRGAVGFRIVDSRIDAGAAPTVVPPDTATCPDCLAELRDPGDRRYRYPFIACSRCGPRFTIVTGLPYDRPRTTMNDFPLCEACAAEYDEPLDRRFHAQPTCCARCGPRLWFDDPLNGASGTDGSTPRGPAALDAAVEALAAGRIVAVKGVGGYHLVCDPLRPGVVDRLRARKNRSAKPLAVMVRDVATAARWASVDDVVGDALRDAAAPVVLAPVAPRDEARDLAALVAPGLGEVGMLLPYTGLHHLLFERFDVLVVTSGNRADEPLSVDPPEARARLEGIADAWLHHDRRISAAADDSVLRVIDGQARPLRRSRGYAPLPVTLNTPSPPLLAVGAELKATACLADRRRAWLTPHIGDLADLGTLRHFERTIDRLAEMSRIRPEVIVADQHPGYLSRRWAEERAAATGAALRLVQHHHAHLAALLAESGTTGPVLGAVFDGTGYGADGTIWGGELLLGDAADVVRVGHLAPVALPGADAAIRRPARSALAFLHAAGVAWDDRLPAVAAADADERAAMADMLRRGSGCTPTSSIGRLFDAVASLAGVRHDIGYEAQAAMELEALAAAAGTGPTQWRLEIVADDPLRIDSAPLVRAVAAAALAGRPADAIAWGFHSALAVAIVESATMIRSRTGVSTVGLTGGVFGNALLSRMSRGMLVDAGFTVLQHRVVPSNDGGIALGQAAVVAAGGGA
jgi:hydrogenase maturation protein HypF